MNARSRRTRIAGLVAAPLALLAGLSGASTATAGAASLPQAKKAHAVSFASSCKTIRARYPRLPKKIDVAVSPFNPPSESADPKDPAKIIGLEPAIITRLSHCLGFTYHYTSEGFATVITSLQSGRSPLGITALYVTPPRKKIIAFVTYRTAEDQVVTTPSRAKKLHAPMNLCGLSVGVTTGSVELAYMKKLSAQCTKAHKKAIPINIYQDLGSDFLAVASGHVDFTSNAAELTPSAIKQYPGKLAGSFLVKPLSFTVGIGVAKRQHVLGHAVTFAMRAMQKAGIEKALLEHWGYPASTQKPARYLP